MQQKNIAATEHLTSNGWIRANEVVADLIDGGFLEADPLTEPERIAQAARDWMRSTDKNTKEVFSCAVGWGHDSWAVVLDEEVNDHDLIKHRNIFWALVLLAKDAGVEL